MTQPRPIPPALRDHRRQGKTFIPPLADLPTNLLDWQGKWLPEHLWLAYLMRGRTILMASRLYIAACDVIDTYYEAGQEGEIFLGYMSDFHRVPEQRRNELREALVTRREVSGAFGRDF